MPVRPPQNHPIFDGYNSLDLLTSIAGLSILPENHGKGLRMELLTNEVLMHFNSVRPTIATNTLRRFLDDEYPSYHMEDPTTNLFTDLVLFYEGDCLVFPGATEGGSFVLNHLVSAIFHTPNSALPRDFKTACYGAIMFALKVSTLVAERMGFTRYQCGIATDEQIAVPDEQVLETAKSAVVITGPQMQELLATYRIAARVVDQFAFNVAEFQANTTEEESYLLQKPILRHGDSYIVVSPLTISHALTEFVWEQARRHACIHHLDEAYQTNLWQDVHRQLVHMGFAWEDASAQIPAITHANHRGVYRFDEDKIAIVRLVASTKTTGASQSGDAHPFSRLEGKDNFIPEIQRLPEYSGHQFLDLLIPSLDGTDAMLLFDKVPGAVSLSIASHEFEVVATLGDTDAIDLWKFAVAKQAFQADSMMFMPNFSFLDEFKTYREHQESYYFSDEQRINYLTVAPGYAAEQLFEAKQKDDVHSVLMAVEGEYAHGRAPVKRKDKYGPTYFNTELMLDSDLRFLIGGYAQPVWVAPASMPAEAGTELRNWFYELNDAIAYWLWQVQGGLKPFLNHEVLEIIHVTYECLPLAAFAEPNRNYTRVTNLAGLFNTSATRTAAHIIIPGEILAYLYGPDNAGERVLVEQILTALNQLLTVNGLPNMNAEAIAAIMEEHVPLGMKKKVYILDSDDNPLLDPRYLVKKRTVQEYDTSIVEDYLVPSLGALCPPVGEITNKADKQRLTKNIVMKVLLPRLKERIGQYNQQNLLGKLLALNESLTYRREKLRVQTPTRIACFVGVEQQVEDIMENLGQSNRTTVAVRCLIEHISAEQTQSGRSASTTDIDELVALMDRIIFWGMLGDQIHYDLFEVRMGILPTGRIGTDKTFVREILDPYHISKTHEDVSDAVKYYDQVFPQQAPQVAGGVPEFLDKAFHADYSISFTRVCEFSDALVHLALELEKSVVTMPKEQLRREMERLGLGCEGAEFDAAIKYLTLTKREAIEKLPPGYDNFDVSPWRFNRRLSLLRKPVIAFENPGEPDNPLLYWGFRQVLLSRRQWASQIQENRFRVAEDSAVHLALGHFAGKRGGPLVTKIAKRLDGPDRIVDTEVEIKPKAELKNDTDIGDVDVLVIDLASKIVYSLECKNMAPSRNIHEMFQEMDRFLGSGSDNGLVHKHVVRHEWLSQHLTELSKKYKHDLSEFEVKSFMVTAEDMLTPYLKKHELPLPFVTSYAIEQEGLNALTSALSS